MQRPQSSGEWAVVAALPVAIVGLVLVLSGLGGGSGWRLVGSALCSVVLLGLGVGLFRMQNQDR